MKKRIIEAVAVMLSLTTLVLFSACVGKNNGASGGKTTDTSHGVVTASITSLQSVVTEPSDTQKTGADTSFGGGDVSESKGAAVSTDDTKYSDPTVDASSAVSESGKGQTEPSSYGSQTTAELEWAFTDNIKWKTRFYAFTSYKRVEMEWENTFTFKFNKYISSNLFIYPRFDDNTKRDDHHGYFQFKEFASLGFNYSF